MAWEVVIYDPRAGEIRGHRRLRQFVRQNQSWMAVRHVRTDIVAATCADGRAVVELLAHLEQDGQDVALGSVAVVAESPNDRSVVFRTYCSQWPVDGRRHVRTSHPRALDVLVRRMSWAAISPRWTPVTQMPSWAPLRTMATYASPSASTRPIAAGLSFAPTSPNASAPGVASGFQHCAVTDDGARCVLEYNCVRWGRWRPVPPQAGLAVYERGPDGLLAAARVYDDVEAPVEQR